MSVSFITFCYQKDIERMHEEGFLRSLVESHLYPFDEVILVHQNCRGTPARQIKEINHRIVESEDFPKILEEYGIEPNNKKADEYTHGPTAPHYWKNHIVNHLIGATNSGSEYTVFSDSDCYMVENDINLSWIEKGIDILEKYPTVYMVSPSDGGSIKEAFIPPDIRLTRNVSQQLFLVPTSDFILSDFDIPWDWEFLAPGEPFQEFYYMLEGRIWRWLEMTKQYRAILPEKWRYWHGYDRFGDIVNGRTS